MLALIRRASANFELASERVLFAMQSSIVEPPATGLIASRNDATVKLLVEHGAFGYGELSERVARAAIDRDRRWSRRSVLCVSSSQWHAGSLVDDYGVDPDRILIEAQPFEPFKSAPAVRERDWSAPKFLFAGLDWERKNGARVVEGFRKVRALYPNAELHLMGRVPQVEELGVINHGFLKSGDEQQEAERQDLYETGTCLVVPSLIEPGGHIHAEALSVGMPVIGTKVGGNRELIGSAGLVVTPTDQQEVTDAMLRMCDPQRARSMGQLGQRQVAGRTYQQSASRIYSELVERLPKSVGGVR
jgi:glycosyltransferase involved in cell wall biosynthesis